MVKNHSDQEKENSLPPLYGLVVKNNFLVMFENDERPSLDTICI